MTTHTTHDHPTTKGDTHMAKARRLKRKVHTRLKKAKRRTKR